MPWKKNYSELRKAGYRHPFITRFFNSSFVYLAFGLSAVLVLSLVFIKSKESYDRILEPVEVVSPYMTVDASLTPAGEWAETFINSEPPNVTNWTAQSSTTPRHPLTFKECNEIGLLPKTQYSSYYASGDEASILVQLYAPGQAEVQFEEYKKLLNSCFTTKTDKLGSPTTEVVSYELGFFFTYGDAIFFFKSNDDALSRTLTSWYVTKASNTLNQALCLDLTVTAADSKRNFYIDQEEYTGLLLEDTVKSRVDVSNIPTQVFPPVSDVPYMEVPEGPLPDSLARLPQEPFSKPTVPEDPEDPPKNGFVKEITYQTVDDRGPGCGWEWSSNKTPIVDRDALVRLKSETYTNAQIEIDNTAREFLSRRLREVREGLLLTPRIDKWNRYVTSVESTHAEWEWLNEEREKLRKPWLDYVNAHDNWVNFNNVKANAVKKYEKEARECKVLDDELKAWEDRYGDLVNPTPPAPQPPSRPTPVPPPDDDDDDEENSDSSSSTFGDIFGQASFRPMQPTPPPPGDPEPPTEPTPPEEPDPPAEPEPEPEPDPEPSPVIPPKPPGCTEPPVRVAIIDQSRGSEPQPPRIPEGVTIPGSWKDPITSPTVKLD